VNCAQYNAIGSAVIIHNDLRSADKLALQNALINSIRKYFESETTSENIPEITKEFIKFINSYKITERFISDYKVYYNITANIDQVSESDLGHFIDKITNSVVYFIKSDNKSLLEINPDMFKQINQIFDKFNFSTSHQIDFYNNLSENPDIDELIKQFELSQASYLFYIELNIFCSDSEKTQCTLKSNTQIFSKNERFPTIQAPLTKEKDNNSLFFQNMFYDNLLNTLNYIRKNLIQLPNNEIVNKDYEIKIMNYKKFATVQKILNYLKGKEFITSFKPKAFTGKIIIFNIKSTFNLKKLQKKLSNISNKYTFTTSIDNNSLVINFKNPTFE
jgi:hypothetical protein